MCKVLLSKMHTLTLYVFFLNNSQQIRVLRITKLQQNAKNSMTSVLIYTSLEIYFYSTIFENVTFDMSNVTFTF